MTSSATAANPAVYAVAANGTLSITGGGVLTINGPTTGSGSALTNLLAIDGGYNAATQSGGVQVLNINNSGNVTLNNLIVRNGSRGNPPDNRSDGSGGGLSITHSAVVLNHLSVSGNVTYANTVLGNGVHVSNSTLMVNNSTFYGNTNNAIANTAQGGGMYLLTSTATITNSSFYGNTVTSANGFAQGDGLFSLAGTVTIINSTFSGNTANGNTFLGEGGGLYASLGTLMTVTNSTFSGNMAIGQVNAGAGTYNNLSTLTLSNSIVPDSTNAYTDGGGNVTTATGMNLSTLGNYGGLMQTMLPLPGSSAICAGLTSVAGAPSSDQRGAAHSSAYCVAGQMDAGAVQTSYSLGTAFTTQPPAVVPSGIAITPNPAVTVTENGVGFSGATVSISSANGTPGGTQSETSAAEHKTCVSANAGVRYQDRIKQQSTADRHRNAL